jgi:lipoprotein-releasing system permease protein
MGLITVLSVFNGFNDVIKSHFNTFDPDIKITVAKGKTFIPNDTQLSEILEIKGVAAYTKTIEENVLLKYAEKQYIATIKGVDDSYLKVNRLDTMVIEGEFTIKEGLQNYAVVGQGISYYLQVGLQFIHPIQIYVLRKDASLSLNVSDSYNQTFIFPKGFFAVEQETDSKYLIVPLKFACDLLEDSNSISSLELKVTPGYQVDEVKKQIIELLGPKYLVKNRFEQKELYYRIMKYEKWAIFMILGFILIIASFNVIGSIAVLIIEKKKDIGILYSMGADSKTISRVFQYEGIMISIFGGIAGLILGIILCLLQQRFELLKLAGSGSFIIDAYPVKLEILDIMGVLITVMAIGFTASWFTVKFIIGKYLSDKQSLNF